LIVTSTKPSPAWGEIFGDDVVAAAMIDRILHQAEILALKGDSYRVTGLVASGRRWVRSRSRPSDRAYLQQVQRAQFAEIT
jgi:hypothetical protein